MIETKPFSAFFAFVLLCLAVTSCGKKDNAPPPSPAPQPVNFSLSSWNVNNQISQNNMYDVPVMPVMRFAFPTAINRTTATAITLAEANGTPVNVVASFSNADSVVILTPQTPLQHLSKYAINVSTSLQ